MAKIFNITGAISAAIILCFSITSCSKVNTPEIKEKKLVNFRNQAESADPSYGYTFNYDNQGRLISATLKYDSIVHHDFIWDENTITLTKTSNTGTAPQSYKFVLKNNLVQYFENENKGRCTITYNSANQFVESSNGNTAQWDGDKFIQFTENRVEGILTYGASCEKGYLPFAATLITPSECTVLYLAHPEIGGIRTNQLPSTIDLYLSGKKAYSMNFAYEFDQDGYITKIINDEATFLLTWE